MLVFGLVFHVYLGWFTRYFIQINRGMDVLVQERAMEVSLPAELYSIERKMNAAKHTIEQQKQDLRIAEQRMIRFENHGSTIPKEKLERIFEQFYRLDAG